MSLVTSPPGEHEFLLLEEVASFLRSEAGTVRNLIRAGKLRTVKVGRRRLVARAELQRFLEAARR